MCQKNNELNINIVDVTDNNLTEILKLKVGKSQADFIETVSQCMDEVYIHSYDINWHPVGIYNNKILIGFAMYGINIENHVWLDRFMIDEKFQGHGYGKIALGLLINAIQNEFGNNLICLSVNKKNNVAINLYQNFGFKFIDELDGNDPIMVYNFTSTKKHQDFMS
ncbi:GNAT family N-acetyltransferase [Sedimentibacter sp. zth1]|uniref:GNAT family N-acetyltransferase n=1 Tax=Sedimentibacter sp. zth1 TaxID=2816908 RepID=UPI001A92E926|nr:GNAT family N-acetyltransferase [Sedimentibacter sp. zth1]QSX05688.1 GNAT family N-acetyltransferase [Sedimentibacter sp. zth1]